MRPLVSVIIPAYNAGQYILQTLQSACAQTYAPIEIIVVDDGSKDHTREVVRAFSARDHRVRLIVQDNAGVGAARNTAIRQSVGVYIAPLDADDIWHPRKLEEQVACMERHGSATGLVYCWTNEIAVGGNFIRHCGPTNLEGQVAPALFTGNFIGCASVPLFRAAALARVGYYLTRAEQNGAQGCEDWDLSMRIAEQYDIRVVPQHLVSYRQTGGMSLILREMLTSFVTIQRNAQIRNPALRPRIIRTAYARFYYWLAGRAYSGSALAECVQLLSRAIAADATYLLKPRMYGMLFTTTFRLALRSTSLPVPNGNPTFVPTIGSMFPPLRTSFGRPRFLKFISGRMTAGGRTLYIDPARRSAPKR